MKVYLVYGLEIEQDFADAPYVKKVFYTEKDAKSYLEVAKFVLDDKLNFWHIEEKEVE